VIPIVTPAEMRAIDAAALEPVEVLIARASAAVTRAAIVMLGGAYGRRVLVIAGRGFNGEDGRLAAQLLARRGAACTLYSPSDEIAGRDLARADLVIDAAYGTGFVDRGGWMPSDVGGVPTLAVDIPSGVDALTGEAIPGVLAARRTVSFAALKPGLMLGAGRDLAGEVELVDIGLDTTRASAHQVEDRDVASWLPGRAGDAHKWQSACWVIAGSSGMTGAAHLAARAAYRAGAGYVRLSSPGVDVDPAAPTEAVLVALGRDDWAGQVIDDASRFKAVVVGPGLGRAGATDAQVRELVAAAPIPVVVDGDGLSALGFDVEQICRSRPAATVLTPHDGELARLIGRDPGPDRFALARSLSAAAGAVVLLKGRTTIVAEPHGQVLVASAGDARLATAGTGDVLSGIIGAFVARGMDPWRAAAAAAHVHGRVGSARPAQGLVAGDLVTALPGVLTGLAPVGR